MEKIYKNNFSLLLRFSLLLILGLSVGKGWGQVTLPHYEGINYTAGVGLQTQSGWTTLNTGDDLLVTAGSLTFSGFPGSAGNKVTFDGAGIDAAKLFTQQTSGIVYFSFLINISALGSLNTTGGYCAGFTEGTSSNFGATVWLRADGAGYDIGINPRTTAANTVWSAGTTAINNTHLVVIAYQIVSGTANDVVKMWIDPSLGVAEPAATLSGTNTGTDLLNLNRIFLRQDAASSTPFVQMDEFRIGTTWASVTPAAPTTQASNITFSNVLAGQFDFNWTDGNGTSRAVFAAAATSGTASPISNTTYTANTTFGSGTQIGTTGWYCVYNGSAAHPTDITLNGLATNTAYRLMVVEYNGAAGAESYNISTATNNPNNQTTSAGASPSYVINSNLSVFSTTLGTPSAQQSYTISGANLTPSSTVSVTAPAEFEVSLTSGSFTGTNGNTVNLSTTGGGTITGEPVSIYVRYNPAAAGNHSGNIAHIGAGVSPAVNLAVSGTSTAYFYSKASGDLTTPATFNTATDGSGIDASNFTGANQTFEIYNRPTATITSDWTVSGSGSKIVVGTGSDFTIPSTNSVTGTIDVASSRQLILNNTILPTFGSLGAGSTVEYAQSSATSIKNFTTDAVTYSNLKLSGSGVKSFKNSITTVTGNLTFDGNTNGALTIDAASAATFTTVNLGGDLTYLGTVTSPVDANSYTLVTTSTGTQTITGNNNTARFFRITTGGSGNNVLLSSAGGTTNILVGNLTGGGLTLNTGTTLNLNGNTATFFAGNNTMVGTGTITGSATSNIVINKTGAASFGTLNFTSGSRLLNNLTVNSTATTPNVTLGTPLDINGTLSLTAGALVLNGNTVTLNGPVSYGTGTFTGSATSSLVVGGTAQNQSLNFTQTSAATRSLNNLTLNALSSATLGSALDLYGVLSLTAVSTLDANSQSLTLKSTATGTARVANLTGSFLTNAGNVTVERYIADPGHRAWHLLSAKAVTGSQTIFDSWQESGAVVANKGTWLTSGSTLLPGFDGTSQNGASILIHDQTVPSWTSIPVANTDATALSSRQGYMLFVRGDRSCTPANATITPTVLKANGTLTQGPVAVTVSATGAGYTLVGNPYASPIDMESILAPVSTIDQNFMVWDPTLTGNYGVGGFRAVQRTGANAYDQTPVVLGGTVTNDPTIQFIHSGEAFFLHATGADGVAAFTEASKASSATIVMNPIVRPTPNDQQIIANLMVMNGGNASLADGIRVRFDDNYSASITDDIQKMGNFGENISSYRNGKKLIVEKRPMIVKNDTIFLRMSNTAVKDYRLQIGTLNFVQTGISAFLEDTYKGAKTQLNLNGDINNIDFSIGSDPASANPDRFRIVFLKAANNPVDPKPVPALTVYPNPVRGGVLGFSLAGLPSGIYQLQLLNTNGQAVLRTQLNYAGNNEMQQIGLGSKLPSGIYRLELTRPDGQRAVKTVVIAN